MELSVHDIVALGFFALLVVVAAASLPSLWRSGWSPPAPQWWPYSRTLWKGLYRAIFPGTLGGLFLLVALPCLLVWQANRAPGAQGTAAPLWVQIVLSAVFFVLIGLMVSVVLINRPKFVVPPALRDQRGWMQRHE